MAWLLFLTALALTLLAELFIRKQPHFEVEAIFAFNALYGFAACAALILVAKAIGLAVKRKDDYYDDE